MEHSLTSHQQVMNMSWTCANFIEKSWKKVQEIKVKLFEVKHEQHQHEQQKQPQPQQLKNPKQQQE